MEQIFNPVTCWYRYQSNMYTLWDMYSLKLISPSWNPVEDEIPVKAKLASVCSHIKNYQVTQRQQTITLKLWCTNKERYKFLKSLIWFIPEWFSGFPYFLQLKSEFGNKEFLIRATVSSWSCFCWLYKLLHLWLQRI